MRAWCLLVVLLSALFPCQGIEILPQSVPSVVCVEGQPCHVIPRLIIYDVHKRDAFASGSAFAYLEGSGPGGLGGGWGEGDVGVGLGGSWGEGDVLGGGTAQLLTVRNSTDFTPYDAKIAYTNDMMAAFLTQTPMATVVWVPTDRLFNAEAVSEALRTIVYYSVSDNPTAFGTQQTRTLRINATALSANGTTEQLSIATTIVIVGRNAAPVLSLGTSDSVASWYEANATSTANLLSVYTSRHIDETIYAVLLFPNASATDKDDLEASRLLVTQEGYCAGTDGIGIATTASFDRNNTVSIHNLTAIFNPAACTLQIIGLAPLDVYIDVLRHVVYTSRTPSANPIRYRKFTAKLWDASVTQAGAQLVSNPISVYLHVVAQNDAPVITANSEVSIDWTTPGKMQSSSAPFASIAITDLDDDHITTSTVSIVSGHLPGVYTLNCDKARKAMSSRQLGALVCSSGSNATLDIRGVAPVATYQQFLQSIQLVQTKPVEMTAHTLNISVSVCDNFSRKQTTHLQCSAVTIMVRIEYIVVMPKLFYSDVQLKLEIPVGTSAGDRIGEYRAYYAPTKDDCTVLLDDSWLATQGSLAIILDEATGNFVAGQNVIADDNSLSWTALLQLVCNDTIIDTVPVAVVVTASPVLFENENLGGISNSHPFLPSITKRFKHGEANLQCFDVSSLLATLDLQTGERVLEADVGLIVRVLTETDNATAESSLSLQEFQQLNLFDVSDPLSWSLERVEADVYHICMRGTPALQAAQPFSINGMDTPSARPFSVPLLVISYIKSQSLLTADTTPLSQSDLDEDYVLAVALSSAKQFRAIMHGQIIVDVYGCTDIQAAFVPCVPVVDGKNASCSNPCVDEQVAGTCDNACDLGLSPVFSDQNGSLQCRNIDSAANPDGNYNPFATQSDGQCIYPARQIDLLPLTSSNRIQLDGPSWASSDASFPHDAESLDVKRLRLLVALHNGPVVSHFNGSTVAVAPSAPSSRRLVASLDVSSKAMSGRMEQTYIDTKLTSHLLMYPYMARGQTADGSGIWVLQTTRLYRWEIPPFVKTIAKICLPVDGSFAQFQHQQAVILAVSADYDAWLQQTTPMRHPPWETADVQFDVVALEPIHLSDSLICSHVSSKYMWFSVGHVGFAKPSAQEPSQLMPYSGTVTALTGLSVGFRQSAHAVVVPSEEVCKSSSLYEDLRGINTFSNYTGPCQSSPEHDLVRSILDSHPRRSDSCSPIADNELFIRASACLQTTMYIDNDDNATRNCDMEALVRCLQPGMANFKLAASTEKHREDSLLNVLPPLPAVFHDRVYFATDKMTSGRDLHPALWSVRLGEDLGLLEHPFGSSLNSAPQSIHPQFVLPRVKDLVALPESIFFTSLHDESRSVFRMRKGEHGLIERAQVVPSGRLPQLLFNYNGILTFWAGLQTAEGLHQDLWLYNADRVQIPDAVLSDSIPTRIPRPLSSIRAVARTRQNSTLYWQSLIPSAIPISCAPDDGWYPTDRVPNLDLYPSYMHAAFTSKFRMGVHGDIEVAAFTDIEDRNRWSSVRAMYFAGPTANKTEGGLWQFNISDLSLQQTPVPTGELTDVFGPAGLYCYRGNVIFTAEDEVSGQRNIYGFDTWSHSLYAFEASIAGLSIATTFAYFHHHVYFTTSESDGGLLNAASLWTAGASTQLQLMHTHTIAEYRVQNLLATPNFLYFHCERDQGTNLCGLDRSGLTAPLIGTHEKSTDLTYTPVAAVEGTLLAFACNTSGQVGAGRPSFATPCDILSARVVVSGQDERVFQAACLDSNVHRIGDRYMRALHHPTQQENALFGYSVSIDPGTQYFGDTTSDIIDKWPHVLGLRGEGKYAYMLASPPGMRDVKYGRAGGSILAVGSPGSESVFLYRRAQYESGRRVDTPDECPGEQWLLLQSLQSPTGCDKFGSALSLWQDSLIIGCAQAVVLFSRNAQICPVTSPICRSGFVHDATFTLSGLSQLVANISTGYSIPATAQISAIAIFGRMAAVGVDNAGLDATHPAYLRKFANSTNAQSISSGIVILLVYDDEIETWVATQVLSPADLDAESSVLYSASLEVDPTGGFGFGCSLALDYGRLAVGVCGVRQRAGLVHLYTWMPGAGKWMTHRRRTLMALDEYGQNIPPGCPASFGASLSMHGPVLVVGAPSYVRGGSCVMQADTIGGATYTFVSDAATDTTWKADAQFAADVLVSDSDGLQGLGYQVAVTTQAIAMLASIKNEGSIAVRSHYGPLQAPAFWQDRNQYELRMQAGSVYSPGRWTNNTFAAFGAALAIGGDIAVVGSHAENGNSGSVYVSFCGNAECDLAGGFYTVRACSAATHPLCLPCSRGPCPRGFVETSPCSKFSDRVCAPCANCTESIVALPDAQPHRAVGYSPGSGGKVKLQRYKLAELYDATGGSRWVRSMQWAPMLNAMEEPCNANGTSPFPGISCDTSRNIISISLPNAGLTGTLPPAFGNGLGALKILKLSANRISGTVPLTVGALRSLEFLDISDNNFHGVLPQSIGQLPFLRALHVHNNPSLDVSDTKQALLDRNLFVDM